MLTKTQRNGSIVALGGATAVAVGTGLAGYLFLQNMKVGASPSDVVMQIIQLLFGLGGTTTIGGLLTTLISWFRNRKTQSLVTPDLTHLDATTVPQGVSLQGADTAELIELTAAFFAFIADRTSIPKQKRLIIALTGIADIVPNLTAELNTENELVLRYKLSKLAVLVATPKPVPVQMPLVSKIGEAGNA